MSAEQAFKVEAAYDIIIAGSGAAGMRAAIEAHDRGARVALLAKGPPRANHTRMSGAL